MNAFVYKWTNLVTGMMYIGVHKGTLDDGYVCSSKVMLNEYVNNPEIFSREILSVGTVDEMRGLEEMLLKAVDAAKNPIYYNMHNSDGKFFCDGHNSHTILKMRNAKLGKPKSEETKFKMKQPKSETHRNKIRIANSGKPKSEEHKAKLRKPKSEEHKAKLRKPKSEEHKAKLSIIQKQLAPIRIRDKTGKFSIKDKNGRL